VGVGSDTVIFISIFPRNNVALQHNCKYLLHCSSLLLCPYRFAIYNLSSKEFDCEIIVFDSKIIGIGGKGGCSSPLLFLACKFVKD